MFFCINYGWHFIVNYSVCCFICCAFFYICVSFRVCAISFRKPWGVHDFGSHSLGRLLDGNSFSPPMISLLNSTLFACSTLPFSVWTYICTCVWYCIMSNVLFTGRQLIPTSHRSFFSFFRSRVFAIHPFYCVWRTHRRSDASMHIHFRNVFVCFWARSLLSPCLDLLVHQVLVLMQRMLFCGSFCRWFHIDPFYVIFKLVICC